MKLINPSTQLLIAPLKGEEALKFLESVARVSYKSESRVTKTSSAQFINSLILKGHESVLEHLQGISVKFICSRAISHMLIRHRLFSFTQESQRYCNYTKDRFGGDVVFVKPLHVDEAMLHSFQSAEIHYRDLIGRRFKPEEARQVLPNAVKTEVVMTGNVRSWRHFLKLRTAKDVDFEMLRLTSPLLRELREIYPILFDDI
jgi:thymidylate synthase (FAD)